MHIGNFNSLAIILFSSSLLLFLILSLKLSIENYLLLCLMKINKEVSLVLWVCFNVYILAFKIV